MAGDVFGWLDGVSPWVWVTLGLALGAAELGLGTFFLLWPAAAALLTGLVMFAAPGLAGTWQVTLFAALAAGLAVTARLLNLRRRGAAASDHPELNRRGARLVGRRGRVLEAFVGGEGVVEVDGLRWRARLAGTGGAGAAETGPAADAAVRVLAVDGAALVVEPEG